jgi:hypothetical protein
LDFELVSSQDIDATIHWGSQRLETNLEACFLNHVLFSQYVMPGTYQGTKSKVRTWVGPWDVPNPWSSQTALSTLWNQNAHFKSSSAEAQWSKTSGLRHHPKHTCTWCICYKANFNTHKSNNHYRLQSYSHDAMDTTSMEVFVA